MAEGQDATRTGENKSFWATLPGIITALAALLTAIGGTATAITQCSGPESTSSADSSFVLEVGNPVPLAQPDSSATHEVRVRLQPASPGGSLDEVDYVTYQLPPSFGKPNVDIHDARDSFAITFGASGSFEIHAKVHLKDGESQEVPSEQISLPT